MEDSCHECTSQNLFVYTTVKGHSPKLSLVSINPRYCFRTFLTTSLPTSVHCHFVLDIGHPLLGLIGICNISTTTWPKSVSHDHSCHIKGMLMSLYQHTVAWVMQLAWKHCLPMLSQSSLWSLNLNLCLVTDWCCKNAFHRRTIIFTYKHSLAAD